MPSAFPHCPPQATEQKRNSSFRDAEWLEMCSLAEREEMATGVWATRRYGGEGTALEMANGTGGTASDRGRAGQRKGVGAPE